MLSPRRPARRFDRSSLAERWVAVSAVRDAFGAALFETGRPVLVSGTRAVPLRLGHVVVAWDGSAQAARALGAALPFLSLAEQVTVVTSRESGEDYDELAGGPRLFGLARDCCRVPRNNAASQRRRGPGTAAAGTDLLVMGGYSHSRLREMILGGVTRHMLEKATLPLLLAH